MPVPTADASEYRACAAVAQKWYAFRWHGSDDEFNLRAHIPAEFSEFRWAELSEITGLIVPFKRKVYARVTSEFEGFAHRAK